MNVQTATPPSTLAELAESLKEAWRGGTHADAVRALDENPALLRHRTLVVDLAYEEYCIREQAGDTPAAESFCRQFPAYHSEIREVIRGHRLLADHPELLAPAPNWPRPGERFEDLHIVRELGRGAFARVFLARDPTAG